MTEYPTEGLLVNPRGGRDAARALNSAWDKCSKKSPELFNQAIGISTSGSTSGGIGSIILLSKVALEESAMAVNRRLGVTSKDVWGLALPLFHVGGYSIPLRAKLSDSRVTEFSEAWNARVFHAWLVKEKITLLSLVPTQLYDLLSAELKSPKSVRAIVIGGGRLDESLHAKALELGWPILQSYGLTECCSQVATAQVGSDGRRLEVLDHVEVRVDDQQKLWLRSKSLLTARIFFDRNMRPVLEQPVGADGWFETADRASLEALPAPRQQQQVLKILGRDGETVKVLGELVDLVRVRSKIEDVVLAHEKLAPLRNHTWVVAVPNARTENELVMMCETGKVPKQASETQEAGKLVRNELRKVLAPFEVPARIIFVEEIPRSALGKVLSSLLTDEARKRSP